MSERWLCSFSFLKSILDDAWLIICEIIIILFPREENYIRSASCHYIFYVMSVKSNIMLHLRFIMRKSRCHNRLDPFFIIYIPNRNRLRNTVWQRHNIVWIWRDVEIDHPVFMGVKYVLHGVPQTESQTTSIESYPESAVTIRFLS